MAVKQIQPPSRKFFHPRALVGLGAAVLLGSGAACSGASGKTVVGPSAFVKCQVAASVTPTSFPPEGGGGQLSVTTERECTWSAKAGASWIALASPETGQGSASVKITVAENPDPSPRSAAVAINDQQVQVAQQAGVCRYQLSSTAANVPSSGGSATIDVTTSSAACEWTARSDASWIAIREGTSGRGSGRVTFDASPTAGPPRAGTVIVADQTITVTQGDGCAFRIAPTSQTAGASGGSGTVTVTTGDGCAWTATSQASWITITAGASGQGGGTLSFSVAATSGPARTGTLIVAGQTFTVTQSQGCSYAIAPSSAAIPAGGGSGDVSVTTDSGCGWTAASNATWISITAGASGNGPGAVRYSVSANIGPARSGTLTIAGRSFAVTQAAACTYALSADSVTTPPAGGSGTVNVAAPAGCAWTASADPSATWVRITAGAPGSGDGTVEFAVDANPGAARSAVLAVAGRPFTVQQSSGCTYSINPSTQTVAAAGGSAGIDVTAPPSCTWTATSGAAWLSITSGDRGTGNGAVQFSAATNPGPPRSGTVAVAGLTATVEQQSGCAYAIAPTSQLFEARGGTGIIAVTTGDGCTWTATSGAEWITVASGASGTGNGSVSFAVAENTGAPRSGTITAAGQTFTVTQAAAPPY